MIYITGDTHGYVDMGKLCDNPKVRRLKKGDYLIICGDFGLPFFPSDVWQDEDLNDVRLKESREKYRYWIKWLSERLYTVLFVDGNHDNHAFWAAQPDVAWNGGVVHIHPDAKNVIHLKRGEYYSIEGRTFWTMGGASSIDKMRRTEGFSWWREELPDHNEMEHGLQTLEDHGNKVDYIITHTLSGNQFKDVIGGYFESDSLTKFFDTIEKTVQYKYWYCGHIHVDADSKKHRLRIAFRECFRLGSRRTKLRIIASAVKKKLLWRETK